MEADVSAKSRKRVRKREDLLWNVRRAVASSPNALDKTTLRLCEAAPFTVHNSSYRGGWRRARARSSAAVARLRLVRGSSRPRTRLLQRGFLRPPLYFSLASGFTLARESEPVWARMRRKPLRTRYQTPPKNCVSALRTFIPAPHTHALQLISHANARHSLYAFLHILLSFLQKPTFLVLSTIMTIKMFTLLMFSTLFLSFVFQVHFEYENLVCKQKKQL